MCLYYEIYKYIIIIYKYIIYKYCLFINNKYIFFTLYYIYNTKLTVLAIHLASFIKRYYINNA